MYICRTQKRVVKYLIFTGTMFQSVLTGGIGEASVIGRGVEDLRLSAACLMTTGSQDSMVVRSDEKRASSACVTSSRAG